MEIGGAVLKFTAPPSLSSSNELDRQRQPGGPAKLTLILSSRRLRARGADVAGDTHQPIFSISKIQTSGSAIGRQLQSIARHR